MKAMNLGLILALALGGAVVGCGDDDVAPTDAGGGTDAGVAMDGSAPVVCPSMAPPPDNQMGACCSRASNASRLSMPELRLAGIRVTSPSTLGSTIIRGLLTGALDEERFNWLIRLEGAPTMGSGSVMVRTGLGFRSADGTFTYAMDNAPMPGAANRWNPKTFTGMMDGESFSVPRASDIVTLPIFDDPDDAGATPIILELPLRNLELTNATLSEDRSCIGRRNPSSFDLTQGSLAAFLTVEDTSMGFVDLSATLRASLCMIIAGMSAMSGNCDMYPQSGWMVPPDSICDMTGCRSNAEMAGSCDPATTCNAWHLEAEFAAQGVEITP